MLFQGLVTVPDVAVSLTWEEWERLDPAQRDLYRESAPKDYGNAVSPSKCPAFACFQLCVICGGLASVNPPASLPFRHRLRAFESLL